MIKPLQATSFLTDICRSIGAKLRFCKVLQEIHIMMLDDFLVGAVMALNLPVLCFWVPVPYFSVVFKDKFILRTSPFAVGHSRL